MGECVTTLIVASVELATVSHTFTRTLLCAADITSKNISRGRGDEAVDMGINVVEWIDASFFAQHMCIVDMCIVDMSWRLTSALYPRTQEPPHPPDRRHKEIVESMTKGEVPVRDMSRVGKELGRLEAVLEKQAKVEDKTAEIEDLEEVRRLVVLRERYRSRERPLPVYCFSSPSAILSFPCICPRYADLFAPPVPSLTLGCCSLCILSSYPSKYNLLSGSSVDTRLSAHGRVRSLTTPQVMRTSSAGGGEADKEMHNIAKEELADCTAALDQLRLDLTSLLLPRYTREQTNQPDMALWATRGYVLGYSGE